MKNIIKKEILIALAIIIIGQLIFLVLSPKFMQESFVNRIYATTAVKHRSEDLHKLNEAAHYFGQTMIGWLKFPNFMNQLTEVVTVLPEGSGMSARVQERQNIIFELITPVPIELSTLESVRTFIQGKIDDYNVASTTEFVLSNVDYEQLTVKKTYAMGAVITFMACIVLYGGVWFLRREFK